MAVDRRFRSKTESGFTLKGSYEVLSCLRCVLRLSAGHLASVRAGELEVHT